MVTPPFVRKACGGEETGSSNNKIMKSEAELSEHQKGRKETSKQFVRSPFRMQASGFTFVQVLPYIAPLNTELLREQLVDAYQSKKAFLSGLAGAERKCDELEKLLSPLIGDAEIRKLVQAHFNMTRTDSVMARYMKAIAEIRLDNFCLSCQAST